MKKLILLSALCLTFAGCANTSNGGGWVVGNGMTDEGTAHDGMNSLGTSDTGTAIPDADCSCGPTAKSCDCKPLKNKKRKR